jgi:hypothetical protein
MKKVFYLLFFVSAFAISVNAQVTIGSQDAPKEGAVLELKSSNLGFLPTRISLQRPSSPLPLPDHVDGMVVFNTNATDSLKVGLYYNWNKKWVNLSAEPYTKENWFYMPSIVIDVSGTGGTIDLYGEYKKQLNATGVIKSSAAGTPDKVLAAIPKDVDLLYYVTAYDESVFENITITDKGVMTYGIKATASPDDATFMNIVFVEK